MIAFRSKYIAPAKIQQRIAYGKYVDKNASIIEYEPENKKDLLELGKIARDWRSSRDYLSYASDIYSDAFFESENFLYGKGSNKRFLAVSLQNSHFENIPSCNVLALAELSKNKMGRSYTLDFLQVSPEHNYFNYDRRYKNLGAALINAIKDIAGNKKIIVDSVPSAVGFYELMGFKKDSIFSGLRLMFKRKI